MFPGFITLFRDDEKYVHLFFFKGITDEDTYYYNDLDLSALQKNGYTYQIINYGDQSKDYIFDNKNIKSMSCKLIAFNGKQVTKTLKIR